MEPDLEEPELTKFIANLTQLAHNAGFNAGRQAASDYVKMNLDQPILDSSSTMSKEATEHFFNNRCYDSLQNVINSITPKEPL